MPVGSVRVVRLLRQHRSARDVYSGGFGGFLLFCRSAINIRAIIILPTTMAVMANGSVSCSIIGFLYYTYYNTSKSKHS